MFNCQESSLIELTHSEAWYRILKDRNHVRIPGKNPINLSGYIKDQPNDEWEILDRDGVNIHENEDYVRDAMFKPDMRLTHPCDFFVYNDYETSGKQQDDYGALVLDGSKTDPKSHLCLTREWKSVIDKGEPCCWKSILDKFHKGKTPPSNALIIIDRYLFSYNGESHTDYKNGVRNVYGILNELLPDKFSGEYQVLIVFDDTTISNRATINQISKGIQKIKKLLNRNFTPTIELLTVNKDVDVNMFSETHDRKIISNYYMITCTHGFSAVLPSAERKDDVDYIGVGSGAWSQTIRYEGIYAGITAEDEDLDISSLPIRTTEKTVSHLSNYIKNLMQGRTGFYYICNGNNKMPIQEFRNRLITGD